MKLEVLLSCMNQIDYRIIEKSNITSYATVINQCDWDQITVLGEDNRIKFIETRERGLSKSRNMAIRNAQQEICLICDDDEVLTSDYNHLILNAFERIPDADIIVFDVRHGKRTRLGNKVQKIGYIKSLRISSWQIAFRRESILKKDIWFDEALGAGTPSGCGEENKFLWDCIKSGLKIYYVPEEIASMHENDSTWFFGYDEEFFENRGVVTRYIMGWPLATLYGIYYILTKRPLYQGDIGIMRAFICLYRGIRKNTLRKK